jgi:hypothetical protein
MKADNVVDSDAEIFSKFFASFKLIPPPKSIAALRLVCFAPDLVFFAPTNN